MNLMEVGQIYERIRYCVYTNEIIYTGDFWEVVGFSDKGLAKIKLIKKTACIFEVGRIIESQLIQFKKYYKLTDYEKINSKRST